MATALFDYMIYDASLNEFYGLGGTFDVASGQSSFVDHLAGQLTNGPISLFGIEIQPDLSFAEATKGFTSDATSAFSNSLGARKVAVPEPAQLALVAMGLLWFGLLMVGVKMGTQRRLTPFCQDGQSSRGSPK